MRFHAAMKRSVRTGCACGRIEAQSTVLQIELFPDHPDGKFALAYDLSRATPTLLLSLSIYLSVCASFSTSLVL